jgi:hypothetical protein
MDSVADRVDAAASAPPPQFAPEIEITPPAAEKATNSFSTSAQSAKNPSKPNGLVKNYWKSLAGSSTDFSGASPTERKVAVNVVDDSNTLAAHVNSLLESEIALAAATALISATLLLLLRPPIVKSKGDAERRISLFRVVGISLLTAVCALVYLLAAKHTNK